jgi:uncharacterized protein YecE (DUF72 family)
MSTVLSPHIVPAFSLENILIGTAGWRIPADVRTEFPPLGTVLDCYAHVFNAVEVNSSFYRPHRHATYERWAASVPDDFRFSVKMPKEITHVRRLRDIDAPLDRFLAEIGGLGGKLGALLIQLPPSLAFDQHDAASFFSGLRELYCGMIAVEPRHPSWFGTPPGELFSALAIELVIADPPPCPAAPRWETAAKSCYIRLHGAPRIYYSDYPVEMLTRLAEKLTMSRETAPTWCIFDNTAAGRATDNALSLNRVPAISENRSSHRSMLADRR